MNEARGKEFVNVGKMSKADLAQLTAQRAKDEYSLVEAESNLKNYKRQMKQLLQITSEEEFDVAMPTSTDEMAMEDIPTLTSVYTAALDSRPEIKNAQLGIDGSELSIKMAKAQRMPTIWCFHLRIPSSCNIAHANNRFKCKCYDKHYIYEFERMGHSAKE